MDGLIKTYQLQSGGKITVDEGMHRIANDLANRFYSCSGIYRSRDGFDFSQSRHPQEINAYMMALEALDYIAEYGIDGAIVIFKELDLLKTKQCE